MIVRLSLLIALLSAPAALAEWNQWRGVDRDARVAGDPFPEQLDSLERVWSVPLGPSYSGPVSDGKRVFTTQTVGKEREVVVAIDLETGRVIWERSWPGAMNVPFFAASRGSWIRSTPATDGERLFVGGILGNLVALENESGEVLWRLDLPKLFDEQRPDFGFVCSPLLADGALFVEAAGSVIRLEPETGAVIWRTSNGAATGDMSSNGTFSSPIVATIGGTRQLVVQSRDALLGFAVDDGKLLWRQVVPAYRGMNILTPLVIGDAVFTSSYKRASWLFRPTVEADAWNVAEVWETAGQAYMSSPIEHDGVIYLPLGNGRLTAIDGVTGERFWTTKERLGQYWSMAARGDRVLALSDEAELFLWRPEAEEFVLLDRRVVGEGDSWAHLAVVGRSVLIRELDRLVLWRWGAPTETDPQA